MKKSNCFFFRVETENILLKTKAPVPLSFTKILNPPGFITTEITSLISAVKTVHLQNVNLCISCRLF